MNIIVNGAAGRMGQQVCRLVEAEGHTLAAAVDRNGGEGFVSSLAEYTGPADVVIDFSNHASVGELVDYCVSRGLPLVAATTGYTPEEFATLEAGAQKVAIFQSYNMSVGVALLARLVKQAAAIFGGCDVEIVEAHHNRKADAPSGTALMLANAIRETRPEAAVRCGREGHCPRVPGEIGIHSVRRGEIVGIHEVVVSTATQTITLRHEAHTRALFAEGALDVARFLQGKEPGLYGMQDMIG